MNGGDYARALVCAVLIIYCFHKLLEISLSYATALFWLIVITALWVGRIREDAHRREAAKK